MPSLAQVEQWGTLLVIFLAAWVAVFKGAAGIFGAISQFWPPAIKAATFCNMCATEIHILGAGLASLIPASTGAKMRAAARRAGSAAGAFFLVIAGGLVTLILGAVLSACAWLQAHPAVASDAQKAEECVETELTKDAAAGDTDITIGVDLGVTCGPLAIQVLEDALANTADAGAGTKAAIVRAARARR
jgi:hypothetical protein